MMMGGMVNYLGKFIPNLSQITVPLRQLLKKDVLFNLQQSQLNAISEISVSSHPHHVWSSTTLTN